MKNKVAVLQTDLIRSNGAELVSMMQARELEADLWCSRYDESVFPGVAEEITIREYGGALPLDYPLSTTWNTVSPAFRNPSFLEEYDTIICHKDLSEILAYRAKKRYGNNVIWYMHNTSDLLYRSENMPLPIRALSKILATYLRKMDKKAFKAADRIFANSKLTIEDVIKPDLGYRRDLKALYPPVRDLESSPNQEGYALVLSRVAQGKNIELAISEMDGRSEELRIAGSVQDERYRKDLEKEAENRGVEVQFLGFVPDDKLGEVISKAKFGIFTQDNAHFGLVPMEMLKAGTPCFVPERTGVAETLPESFKLPLGEIPEIPEDLNLNEEHYRELKEAVA